VRVDRRTDQRLRGAVAAARPHRLCELLLQFFSEREPLPVVPMARGSTIRSRIDLILSEEEFTRRFVSPARAIAFVLGVFPIALAIATLSGRAEVKRSLMLETGSASSTQVPSHSAKNAES
jgi:hypothetical protein